MDVEQLKARAIPDSMVAVMEMPENDACFDCNSERPDWTSLHFGSLICLECAGKHRSMGVHITLVRSFQLDTFTDEQMRFVLLGGNMKLREYVGSKPRKQVLQGGCVNYKSIVMLYYRYSPISSPCSLFCNHSPTTHTHT